MDRLRVTNRANDIVEFEVFNKSQPAVFHFVTFLGLLAAAIWLYRNISNNSLRWLACLLPAYWGLVILTHPTSQSLLVVPPHGIQLSTRSLLNNRLDAFLPSHFISDIVINEGFQRFNIRYYLAVLVHLGQSGGPVQVVVPFQDVTPTAKILEEVYHATRESIFEEYDSEVGTAEGG